MRVLYHGTTPESAEALVSRGWKPGSGQAGANQGQTRYLYLTSGFDDALWFAGQKGSSAVIVVQVPSDEMLRVDPEDGIGETLEEEFNSRVGLPGKVVLWQALGPEAFALAGDPTPQFR